MARGASVCSTPGCPNLTPCATHPPKQRWDNSTRNQRRTGSGWDEQRRHQRILRRDRHRCYLCGATGCTAVDHKIPKFEGGTDDDANLGAICDPCHHTKTTTEAARARKGGG